MSEANRIEVGFIGNQVISLKLDDKQLSELRKKLSGGGWLTIETDEGEVEVDLAKVAFVKVAAGAHSVGFGSS
jgi:hypothetical protein